MTRNIGTVDKAVRISAAALLGLGIGLEWVTGAAAWALAAVALTLVGTSMVSFCGLYTILGISTCKVARR